MQATLVVVVLSVVLALWLGLIDMGARAVLMRQLVSSMMRGIEPGSLPARKPAHA